MPLESGRAFGTIRAPPPWRTEDKMLARHTFCTDTVCQFCAFHMKRVTGWCDTSPIKLFHQMPLLTAMNRVLFALEAPNRRLLVTSFQSGAYFSFTSYQCPLIEIIENSFLVFLEWNIQKESIPIRLFVQIISGWSGCTNTHSTNNLSLILVIIAYIKKKKSSEKLSYRGLLNCFLWLKAAFRHAHVLREAVWTLGDHCRQITPLTSPQRWLTVTANEGGRLHSDKLWKRACDPTWVEMSGFHDFMCSWEIRFLSVIKRIFCLLSFRPNNHLQQKEKKYIYTEVLNPLELFCNLM